MSLPILCIWCLQEKPEAQFHINAGSENGKQSYCVACKAAYDIFMKQCVNVTVRAGKIASRRGRELLKQKHALERQMECLDTQIEDNRKAEDNGNRG